MYKPKQANIISLVLDSKLVEQGYLTYLAHVRDAEIKAPSIGFIMVVSEFDDVFQTNFPRMPPKRDIPICNSNLVCITFLTIHIAWLLWS